MESRNYQSLVSAAKSGDNDSWTTLLEDVKKHIGFITREYFPRSIEDQEDALQEVLAKIYTKIDTLEDGDKFIAWAKKIAVNTCTDIKRKHKDFTFSDIDPNADGEYDSMEFTLPDVSVDFQPEAQMDMKATAEIIHAMLAELPEDQKISLELLYGSEMSVKEIAESMGCTENTVKSRLHYGRNAMEKKIEDLRKKGTKLYAIPFGMLLYSVLHSDMEAYAAGTVITGIAAETASKAAGKTAADVAAKSTAGKTGFLKSVLGTTSGKIVAGVTAAAIGVGTVTAVLPSSGESLKLTRDNREILETVYEYCNEFYECEPDELYLDDVCNFSEEYGPLLKDCLFEVTAQLPEEQKKGYYRLFFFNGKKLTTEPEGKGFYIYYDGYYDENDERPGEFDEINLCMGKFKNGEPKGKIFVLRFYGGNFNDNSFILTNYSDGNYSGYSTNGYSWMGDSWEKQFWGNIANNEYSGEMTAKAGPRSEWRNDKEIYIYNFAVKDGEYVHDERWTSDNSLISGTYLNPVNRDNSIQAYSWFDPRFDPNVVPFNKYFRSLKKEID